MRTKHYVLKQQSNLYNKGQNTPSQIYTNFTFISFTGTTYSEEQHEHAAQIDLQSLRHTALQPRNADAYPTHHHLVEGVAQPLQRTELHQGDAASQGTTQPSLLRRADAARIP